MVLVGEERHRDAPIVDLGQAREQEHARDVEPEPEQQQRLQLADQPGDGAVEAGKPAERRG